MNWFGKFSRKKARPISEVITPGIIENQSTTPVTLKDLMGGKDSSKGIHSEHWDALPKEAQDELKKLGYYRISSIKIKI